MSKLNAFALLLLSTLSQAIMAETVVSPSLQADYYFLDAGLIQEGEEVPLSIELSNSGNSSLFLLKAVPSCSCTYIGLESNTELAPRNVITIPIKLRASVPGRVSGQVTFQYFDGKEKFDAIDIHVGGWAKPKKPAFVSQGNKEIRLKPLPETELQTAYYTVVGPKKELDDLQILFEAKVSDTVLRTEKQTARVLAERSIIGAEGYFARDLLLELPRNVRGPGYIILMIKGVEIYHTTIREDAVNVEESGKQAAVIEASLFLGLLADQKPVEQEVPLLTGDDNLTVKSQGAVDAKLMGTRKEGDVLWAKLSITPQLIQNQLALGEVLVQGKEGKLLRQVSVSYLMK